jgi:hypothetical protein
MATWGIGLQRYGQFWIYQMDAGFHGSATQFGILQSNNYF